MVLRGTPALLFGLYASESWTETPRHPGTAGCGPGRARTAAAEPCQTVSLQSGGRRPARSASPRRKFSLRLSRCQSGELARGMLRLSESLAEFDSEYLARRWRRPRLGLTELQDRSLPVPLDRELEDASATGPVLSSSRNFSQSL